MSRTLNASFILAKDDLESQGMVNLYEIQVTDTPNYAYYAEYNATISYFKPETGTAQDYSPAPITHGEIETDDGSKVPSVNINIGGADQTIQGYLENQDALRRFRIRKLTVPYQYLGNASAYIIDTFYVDGCVVDHGKEIAQFEVTSKGQVADVTVPLRHMRRDYCPWRYNASECLASSVSGQYISAHTDSKCKKIKADCASKVNVVNFGGFPGIGTKQVHF